MKEIACKHMSVIYSPCQFVSVAVYKYLRIPKKPFRYNHTTWFLKPFHFLYDKKQENQTKAVCLALVAYYKSTLLRPHAFFKYKINFTVTVFCFEFVSGFQGQTTKDI